MILKLQEECMIDQILQAGIIIYNENFKALENKSQIKN